MIQTAEEHSFLDRAGQNDPCLRWEQADDYLEHLQKRPAAAALIRGGDLDGCLDRLLAISKSRGASDNVTAVLMLMRKQ